QMRLDQAQQRLQHARQQTDAAVLSQEQFLETVAQRLRDDPDFQRLSQLAARAEAELERAEANLAAIEFDAQQKLPPYENSDLFQYLVDADFGTDAYARRGFSRRMDRWVAKLIGFADAKRSYDFLMETPQTMRRVIAEDRDALDEIMSEIERSRDEISSSIGLDDAVQRVVDAQQHAREIVEEMDDMRRNLEHARMQSLQLEAPGGPLYTRAVTLFRDMLSGLQPQLLEDRARQTLEFTDDQIVSQLQRVDQQIEEVDQQFHHRQTLIHRQNEFIGHLGSFIQRFQSAGFDAARSQFDDRLDTIGQLQSIQDGTSSFDQLWSSLQAAHSMGPSTMDRIAQVAAHPATQVLVNAMAHAAGAALRDHARRAGDRRYRRR
ncbi:MAG: hypothetical protein AAFN70_19000, partial [Planctomycetota bacterium]